MDTDILEKYIDGELPESEMEKITSELEKDAGLRQRFAELYAEKTFGDLPDSFNGGKDFQDRIMPAMSGGSKKRYPILRRFFKAVSSVCAILFIPLCIYEAIRFAGERQSEKESLFTSYDSYEHHVPMVEQKVNSGVKGFVSLPDGSRVWLNSGSELSFPAEFDTVARVVRLDGEAFFDVVSEPERPMYIECRDRIVVRVTGTEFNITSYGNDNSFSLLLVSGNLTVKDKVSGKVYSLSSSQQLTVFDDSSLRPVKTRPVIEDMTGWKEGRLVFDDTSMEEVVKRLERWFGIKVVVTDECIEDYRFTATFETESVTRVFDILEKSSGIKYSLVGNTVTLSL